MKIPTIKIALFSLVTAALVAVPATSHAQDKPKTDAPAPAAPAAMTITVGSQTISITSETKIIKDEKPATLSEIAVGDTEGGAYKKDAAGKLNATTIHATAKDPKEPKKEKKMAGEPAK